MEIWPENDPVVRLKHGGIIVLITLFIATLELGKYLESFPPLITLPITASLPSFAYIFTCLTILLGLGIKCLSVPDKQKTLQYGLAFWGFLTFSCLMWGGFQLINIKADTNLPSSFEVIVIGKHSIAGKGGGSDYLDVVNVLNKKFRFRVTSHVFLESKPKDKFYVWFKKGYFNQPWVLSYKKLENSE